MRTSPTNDFEEVLAATSSLSPSSSRRSSLSSSPLGQVRGVRPSSSSDLEQVAVRTGFRRNVSFGEGVELESTFLVPDTHYSSQSLSRAYGEPSSSSDSMVGKFLTVIGVVP
ncbi:hypothetical protein EMIHUDRAFT_435643 [Emiliania huxleyi CCMP1516]|uniref:Uncharacterized protein n=2 Tax=Emiliania huxleyi TaxID=2903 RepID=A0A0D3JDN6_EMIH1|nr:hypothetical protein EMIHUDRAFT_435643 [Emiliania huxleyi CCMP1516]EOD21621.1 hypothetical protein EMIHUDRAFT_435643 [Emiliania huxleyi CCMP1516]|eukprot:XP_005774050.1 hypothetical protein EMIHUDRAFT_435643 [Emiliania huxleyi CCMP1516]